MLKGFIVKAYGKSGHVKTYPKIRLNHFSVLDFREAGNLLMAKVCGHINRRWVGNGNIWLPRISISGISHVIPHGIGNVRLNTFHVDGSGRTKHCSVGSIKVSQFNVCGIARRPVPSRGNVWIPQIVVRATNLPARHFKTRQPMMISKQRQRRMGRVRTIR